MSGGAVPEPYGIERGHRVPGPDLAAVHAVVAEVVVGHLAVLVPDELELLDVLRVEGDLRLGVAGPQFDVGGKLVDEDLAGLGLVADVGGVAVALVGEAFHQRVPVVTADADAEEGDAVLAAGVVDPFEDGVGIGLAGVGEGVGEQDDPVVRARTVTGDRLFVTAPDTRFHIG